MKIKKQLPQFDEHPALLIVLGGREGVFYFAKDGQIEQVGSSSVSVPKYSDNEGFFRTRGRGGMSISGSVREFDKNELQKKFANACVSTLKQIQKAHSFEETYLFVPARLKNLIKEALPARVRKKIVKTKTGNHHEKHPFEILDLLQPKK